jgi:hypothetical protein
MPMATAMTAAIAVPMIARRLGIDAPCGGARAPRAASHSARGVFGGLHHDG